MGLLEGIWLHACEIEILAAVFPDIVDIIFERFSITKPEKVKRSTTESMANVITRVEAVVRLPRDELAKATITIARMRNELGGQDLQQARKDAERAFDSCVADLEGSVNRNDAVAFRALGRVLMFAGLEVDAGIALSLTFSEVERRAEAALLDGGDFEDSTDHDGVSEQNNPASSPAGHTSHKSNGIPPIVEIAKGAGEITENYTDSASPKQQDTIQLAGNTIPILSADDGTKEQNAMIMNGTPRENGTLTPKDSHGDALNATGNNDVKPQQQETLSMPHKDPILSGINDVSAGNVSGESENKSSVEEQKPLEGKPASSVKASPDATQNQQIFTVEGMDLEDAIWDADGQRIEDDQDVVDSVFSFSCNGTCSRPASQRWKPAVQHLGITVWTATTLTSVPIAKIEGWEGVKDGVIRIGGKRKPFQDWLEEVKGKWQKQMATMFL